MESIIDPSIAAVSTSGELGNEQIWSLWINGDKYDGLGGDFRIANPATGQSIACCTRASREDVEEAVKAASEAFRSGKWSKMSRHERADVLDKAGAIVLEEHLPALIHTEVLQTGRVIREMKAQIPSLVRWFKYYASVLRTEERPVLPTSGKLHNWLDRKPLGVVAQITPFNHPLLIAIKKLVPALAAGNSVILKPNEFTPLTSLMLGPMLRKAGLPAGVFNVVHGDTHQVAEYLVRHPSIEKVDFTGSTRVGREIGSAVGGNLVRYTAECGGKAPLIIFSDADIDAAVNGIAFGAFIASGQTCVAATRIIVEKTILPSLIEKLRRKAESITQRMGSPLNQHSTMGPLISADSSQRVHKFVSEAVSEAGAELIFGGERLTGLSDLDGFDFSKGFFYPPTILRLPHFDKGNMPNVWLNEIFGPVIVLVDFETEDEAIDQANLSEFGLGAGIWTKDLSRAFRVSEEINSGIIWVNAHHRNDPSSPWGGVTKSSGVGSENGLEAYYSYTKIKSTIINYASSEETLLTEDWFGEGPEKVRYG